MENKMSFVFMPSLKEMAMRRLAIVLWSQPDMLAEIENFCKVSPDCCRDLEKWCETVENKIIEKLMELVMPKSLSKQMLHIIRLIGLQIPRWKVLHEHYLEVPGSDIFLEGGNSRQDNEKYLHLFVGFGASVLEKLCWTTAGTIDYRQTAIELIRHEIIDPEQRYRLACYYCLEDCIPLLWEELPRRVKRKYHNGGRKIHDLFSQKLPYCWPYILRGKQAKLEGMLERKSRPQRSFKQIALICSGAKCNKFALEYFFQKLSDGERNFSFLSLQDIFCFSSGTCSTDVPQELVGEVMSFLLSRMDYERQMEIIQELPIKVLYSFIFWPWQDIFLEISDIIWGLISTEQYATLLDMMIISCLYSNYSFPSFFQEWFTRSPMKFRKWFVDYEARRGEMLTIIFKFQDYETIEVVLRNIDAADRVQLVSSEHFLKFYQNSIFNERFHMVKMCLREARLTEVDRERVCFDFKLFLARTDGGRMEKIKPVLLRFLQILNETYEISKRKRSLDDDTQNKAIKLSFNE